jgi:hypothetical protein
MAVFRPPQSDAGDPGLRLGEGGRTASTLAAVFHVPIDLVLPPSGPAESARSARKAGLLLELEESVEVDAELLGDLVAGEPSVHGSADSFRDPIVVVRNGGMLRWLDAISPTA